MATRTRTTQPEQPTEPEVTEPAPPAPETEPSTTTLDSHLDAPSVTAPGDGPADTTDPNELASTATPDKAAAAQAGHGTVNAVVKVGEGPDEPDPTEERTEIYEAVKPDGTKVTVVHDLNTGATRIQAGEPADQD